MQWWNKMEYEFETITADFKIFIDTCSLLCNDFEEFWKNIQPFLKKYNNKIYSLGVVCRELQKHQNNPKLSRATNFAIKTINEGKQNGLIEIRDNINDGDFADQIFLSLFTYHFTKHNLALITQDIKLANDVITALKAFKSVASRKRTLAYKIANNGKLSMFSFQEN